MPASWREFTHARSDIAHRPSKLKTLFPFKVWQIHILHGMHTALLELMQKEGDVVHLMNSRASTGRDRRYTGTMSSPGPRLRTMPPPVRRLRVECLSLRQAGTVGNRFRSSATRAIVVLNSCCRCTIGQCHGSSMWQCYAKGSHGAELQRPHEYR